MLAVLAIGSYFTCLGFAYSAIFGGSPDRKKANAQEAGGMFIAEVISVVVAAFFVIWAKLDPVLQPMPD